MMDRVCMAVHKPPNVHSVVQERYFTEKEREDPAISLIPVVISQSPSTMFFRTAGMKFICRTKAHRIPKRIR